MQARDRYVVGWTVCLALVLGACGGGGGGEAPAPQTVSLAPDGNNTGYVYGGVAGVTKNNYILVGDTATDTALRGFYRFELTGIPSTATVVSAELRTFQDGCLGNPYQVLGNMLLDHMDFGAALTDAAYAGPVLSGGTAFATLCTDANVQAVTADCTAQVQADLQAGRGHTDLRLRFTLTTNNDGVDWYAYVITPTNMGPLATDPPRLVVTWQ